MAIKYVPLPHYDKNIVEEADLYGNENRKRLGIKTPVRMVRLTYAVETLHWKLIAKLLCLRAVTDFGLLAGNVICARLLQGRGSLM